MHARTLMSLPLLALALGGFVVGSSEFIIMGLLPELAADLHVSLADAGLLVSAYALGVVVGAPLLGPLLDRAPRRQAVILLMLAYTLGNLGCALAPDYHWLLGARLLTAISHAGFFGSATLLARELAPPHRQASAMAMVISGLTIANVLGVPLGAWLGQTTSWRVTFFVVAGIGAVTLACQFLWLPATAAPARSATGSWNGILRKPVLHALLVCSLTSVSLFTLFTYISPFLREVTGFTPEQSNGALLLMGIGLTLGNILGGRLADRGVQRAVPKALALSAALVFGLYLFGHMPIATLLILFGWGIATFAVSTPLQLLLVEQAGESASLAATLSHAAFNLGNAAGAWFGGIWLSAHLGLPLLPVFAVLLLLLNVCVAWWLPRLKAVSHDIPLH